jgi:hypothetical protein
MNPRLTVIADPSVTQWAHLDRRPHLVSISKGRGRRWSGDPLAGNGCVMCASVFGSADVKLVYST